MLVAEGLAIRRGAACAASFEIACAFVGAACASQDATARRRPSQIFEGVKPAVVMIQTDFKIHTGTVKDKLKMADGWSASATVPT